MRSMTVEERRWTVGPVLENQRKKLGLSLDQVATRAGVARATVRYYETGYRADNGAAVNPTVKVLRAHARQDQPTDYPPLSRATGVPAPWRAYAF